jgi:hypothetical protein
MGTVTGSDGVSPAGIPRDRTGNAVSHPVHEAVTEIVGEPKSASWRRRLIRRRGAWWSGLGAPGCALRASHLAGTLIELLPSLLRREIGLPSFVVVGARRLGVSFARVFDAGKLPRLASKLVAQVMV